MRNTPSQIRLFGDPRDKGSDMPTLRVNFKASIHSTSTAIVHQTSHDIVCDFVEGYALGDALGVGLRSHDGWWKVEGLDADENLIKACPFLLSDHGRFLRPRQTLSPEIIGKQILAPMQTRVVPIRLDQREALIVDKLSFRLVLSPHLPHGKPREQRRVDMNVVHVDLKIRHRLMWTDSHWNALLASFLFAESHPTLFLIKPPEFASRKDSVPILALREKAFSSYTIEFMI